MSLQLSAHDLAETAEMHQAKNVKRAQRRRRMSYNLSDEHSLDGPKSPGGTRGKVSPSDNPTGESKKGLPLFVPRILLNEDGIVIRPNLRERIYLTFEEATLSKLGFGITVLVIALIVVSSVCFILESQPGFRTQPAQPCSDAKLCRPKPLAGFATIELVCILVFTIEYIARLATAHAVRPPPPPIKKDILGNMVVEESSDGNGLHRTFLFLVSPMNIIDLVAILPYYLDLIFGGEESGGLSVLRILRLARVFRVFKLGKYNEGMQMFGRVIVASTSALYLLSFFMGISVVLFGAMIYFMEEGTFFPGYNEDGTLREFRDIKGVVRNYPSGVFLRETITGDCVSSGNTLDVCGEPSPFSSISRSFWWVFTTQTTVGYGDMYPTSTAGKVVGSMTMVSGILVLALPITIIGANFANEYGKEEERRKEAALRDAANAGGGAETKFGVEPVLEEIESEDESDDEARAKERAKENSANDVFHSAFAPPVKKPKNKASSRATTVMPADGSGMPIISADDTVVETLASLNPDVLSPMQALALLTQLRARAHRERRGSAGSSERRGSGASLLSSD